LLLLVTKAILPLLLSFLAALVLAVAFRVVIWNKKLPVPSGAYVVITGCSTGIGFDGALHLASLGFKVFASVRKEADGDKLKSTSSAPHLIFPIILDVTNEEHIKQAVQTVQQQLKNDGGKLVGVINNAGYGEIGSMELMSPPLLRKQFEVNVIGSVEVSRAFLPLLREGALAFPGRTARLVFVSSGLGTSTLPFNGVYSASKFAIETIANAFRMELLQWKINVVTVQPGAIKSNFINTASETMQQNSTIENPQCGKQVVLAYSRGLEAFEYFRRSVIYAPASVTSNTFQTVLSDSRPLTHYYSGWTDAPFYPLITKIPSDISDAALRYAFKLN